jgi:hypothetical protein
LLAAVLAYHPFDTVVRRYAIIRPAGVSQITRR